jgi:hypothetical protein
MAEIEAERMTSRVKIGEFGVDGGTCWVGDPCYVPYVPAVAAGDGNSMADAWLDPTDRVDVAGCPVAKAFPVRPGDAAFGLAVITGYGDGVYPVYADVCPDGRVASITVEFIEFVDDDEGGFDE